MPTPFTHLEIATRLHDDKSLPPSARDFIQAEYAAFLPGTTCADARPEPGADREVTHFYRYDKPMIDHPWRVMLATYPALAKPQTPSHRAFIAGYVAHLATDEYWSRYMLKPHFAEAAWGSDMRWRFFVLHLLLIYMDERDLKALTPALARLSQQSIPENWLPFMRDEVICGWRDDVAEQIIGRSKTLDILGGRVKKEPEELRVLLDNPETMQSYLWDNIPLAALAQIEGEMYAFSREQMLIYLSETERYF
jgi:hypothetical protein